MGVRVDKPGRHDVTLGVDHFGCPLADFADGGDTPAGDTHVGAITRHPGTVDDRAVANNKIVLHGLPPGGEPLRRPFGVPIYKTILFHFISEHAFRGKGWPGQRPQGVLLIAPIF